MTPWTTAHQAPPSMGFSKQEYWSGVPLPSPSIHDTITNIHCFFNVRPYEVILIVVLISISLIANNVEHCFMCLLAICISSLKKNVYDDHLPFFWPHKILVPQPTTEPVTLAVEV